MPTPDQRVLVVIPAFNEQDSVGAVIHDVFKHAPDSTVLVVDDGSSDATTRVATEAGALVATLPFNLGVGGAMRLGFRFALEDGFPVVVQVDADGQHDPADVLELVAQLEKADLVLGARFAGKGDYAVRGPRQWAMRVLSSILSKAVGTRLTDTTTGFRASGPRAVAAFAEHYPAEYLGDTIESLVIASRMGLIVRQVPVEMHARAAGTPSHNPFKAATYLARAIMAIVFAFIRPRSNYSAGKTNDHD